MRHDHDWYLAALAQPEAIGTALAMDRNHPQPGFYRSRARKSASAEPVAIWRDAAGRLLAAIGGRSVEAQSVWASCWRAPLSEPDYRAAMAGRGGVEVPPLAIGHNSAGNDAFETLTIEYAGGTDEAAAVLRAPITTSDAADRAALVAKRLAALSARAGVLHRDEKQPHFEAGQRVDDKWRALKEEPKALSTRLKRHLDVFLQEEDRLARERQRQASEAAEQLRREAQDEALKAANARGREKAGEAATAALRAAQAAEAGITVANAAAGRAGARVALRTFVSAVITDYDKALATFAYHPEMRDLVATLAHRAVRSGLAVDGIERVEERRTA